MSDLVQKLRARNAYLSLDEAADRIDALRSRLAEVTERRDLWIQEAARKGVLLEQAQARLAEAVKDNERLHAVAGRLIAVIRNVHGHLLDDRIDAALLGATDSASACPRCNGHGVVPDLRGDQPCPDCTTGSADVAAYLAPCPKCGMRESSWSHRAGSCDGTTVQPEAAAK